MTRSLRLVHARELSSSKDSSPTAAGDTGRPRVSRLEVSIRANNYFDLLGS